MSEKPKALLDYSHAEIKLAIEINMAGMRLCAGIMGENLLKNGLTHKTTLNAHTWSEHLAGSAEFLQKVVAE